MAFDLKTAKLVKEQKKSSSFDINTATQVKPSEIETPGLSIARRILQQVGSNLTRKETRPLGGLATTNIGSIISSASGVPEENVGALALSIGGGIAGSKIGKPHLGFGLGTAAGNLLVQSAKKLRGTGDDINVSDAVLVGAAASAGSKTLEVAFKSAGLIGKLIPEKTRAAFFDKALQAVNVGYKAVKRNWRKIVNKLTEDYPSRTVDLTSTMAKLKSQLLKMDDSLVPQLKTALERSPRLLDAVKSPNMAGKLTLKEAQDLKNAVTSTTNTITKKALKGKTTPNERVVFEILDDFDDAIVGSFKEMIDVKRAYHAGKKAFEMARPLVEPGSTIEKAIFSHPNRFSGLRGTPLFKSVQERLAVKEIMGMTKPGEKMFEAAKLAYKINRVADFIGRTSQLTVGWTALKLLSGGKRKEVEVHV